MHIINITVRNKVAVNPAQDRYVCGNSDFVVHFDFDSEWDAFETKTARFIKEDGTYVDQVFSGNDCPVPVISDTYKIMVGVYAGNLSTTTAAYVPAKKSILCGGGAPADPEPDVFSQLMSVLNEAHGNAKEAAETLEEAFGTSGLYIVRATPDPDFRNFPKADRTQEEIRAAVAAGKTVLLVYSELESDYTEAHEARVMTYAGEIVRDASGNTCPTFDGYIANNTKGITYYYQAYVQPGGYVGRSGNILRAATKFPLKLTGAVEATYDGREAVTVEIPQGGSGGGCIVNAVELRDTTGNDGIPEYGKSDKPFDEVLAAMSSGYVALRLQLGTLTMYLPAAASGEEDGIRMIIFRDLTGSFEQVLLLDDGDALVFNRVA